MKISLERLDARGMQVELPGTGGERFVIAAASGMRGTLLQEAGRLTLSGAAESLVAQALHLMLGALGLSSAGGATFEGFGVALEQSEGHLSLDVTAGGIAAAGLAVEIDAVRVTGAVQLGGARLLVRDGDGSLEAERVELSDVTLRIGDVQVEAPALTCAGVALRWGSNGFVLEARTFEAPVLQLLTKDVRFAATNVALRALALDDRHVEVGQITFAGGQLSLGFAPPRKVARGSVPPAAPRHPLVDWHVLDSLSGGIDVDVDVDLTVPILGRRKATHRMRIPIEGGSIDFRALENNLAALENAVLDFSVRDGALVLERVNPLFPARGHGKPVVVWQLDATDHAIAEVDRVRLAVLPRARVVSSDDGEHEREGEGEGEQRSEATPGRSAVALRTMGLERIDVRLALAPVDGPLAGIVRLRRIDSFVLQGSVFHHPDAPPREGRVLGEISGALLAVAGLRLGTTALDVGSVAFGGLSPIEVAFLDVHPTTAQLEMTSAVLDAVIVTLSG